MPRLLSIVMTLACLAAMPCHAIDLGKVGPVYAITEPDFLVEIKAIVQSKVDSGEWAKIQRDMVRDSVKAMEHPAPVGTFAIAREAKTWYYDPTTILTKDILDAQGQVLYPAGTRVNPLDVVTVGTALFFFDADDPLQVKTLEQTLTRLHGQIKPVAVAGSYLALARKLDRTIYFDQAAVYTKKLGIDVVPALVSQVGNQLKIEEIIPQ